MKGRCLDDGGKDRLLARISLSSFFFSLEFSPFFASFSRVENFFLLIFRKARLKKLFVNSNISCDRGTNKIKKLEKIQDADRSVGLWIGGCAVDTTWLKKYTCVCVREGMDRGAKLPTADNNPEIERYGNGDTCIPLFTTPARNLASNFTLPLFANFIRLSMPLLSCPRRERRGGGQSLIL